MQCNLFFNLLMIIPTLQKELQYNPETKYIYFFTFYKSFNTALEQFLPAAPITPPPG